MSRVEELKARQAMSKEQLAAAILQDEGTPPHEAGFGEFISQSISTSLAAQKAQRLENPSGVIAAKARLALEKKEIEAAEAEKNQAETRTQQINATGTPKAPAAALTSTSVKGQVSGVFGDVPSVRALRQDARKLQDELDPKGATALFKKIDTQLLAAADKHQAFAAQQEGALASLAEAQHTAEQLEIQHAEAMTEHKVKLNRFAIEAQFPGVAGGFARIEQLQEAIEDQRRDPTIEGVTAALAAQTELERGQEVDQGRLLGPVENQIMAAIAIGFGVLGSALSGLPNHGSEMVNAAIEKDIAAQRNRFRLKGETYARNRNLYELVQRQFDKEWERTASLRGFYLQKAAIIAQQMGATRAQQQILQTTKQHNFNFESRKRDQLITMRSRLAMAEIEIRKMNLTFEAKRNETGPPIPVSILEPIESELFLAHAMMRLENQFWKHTSIVSGAMKFLPGAQKAFERERRLLALIVIRAVQGGRVTEIDAGRAEGIIPNMWATRFTAPKLFANFYAGIAARMKDKIGIPAAGGHDMRAISQYTKGTLNFMDELVKLGGLSPARITLLENRDAEMQRRAGDQWTPRRNMMDQLNEFVAAQQAAGGSIEEIGEAKARGRQQAIGGTGARR